MSDGEETKKEQRKDKGIPKNLEERNSTEQTIPKPASKSETQNKKDKSDISNVSGILHLKRSFMKPINVQKEVIFHDALPKYNIKVKLNIPERRPETPNDVSTRDIIFLQEVKKLSDNPPRSVKVPDFNIHVSPGIEIRGTTFNSSLPKIEVSRNLSIGVPSHRTIGIRPLELKNITFDSQIRMRIKGFGESKMQPIVQKVPVQPKGGEDSGMELPWDEDYHRKMFLLGGYSSAENFKIVAVPDKEEYWEFIAMCFRDIYRIQKGGYINDIFLADNVDMLNEEFRKQTAMHQIVIVKIGNALSHDNKKYLLGIIRNKPYQDLGLIILVLKNTKGFIEREIGSSEDILILDETDFQPLFNKSEALTRTIRGFYDSHVSVVDFGTNFKNCVEEFDRKIKEYVDERYVNKKLNGFKEAQEYFINHKHLLTTTRSSSEEEASDIHSGMKGFIYVYERKNGSEAKFEENDGKTLDIDVVADGRCYEAETLFGRKNATALLSEKMSNKGYNQNNKEVIFTMRNIDIIRNFFYLRNFLEHNRGSQIKICGFDFKEEELIPMSKIIGSLM